jgi:hypothetical protein
MKSSRTLTACVSLLALAATLHPVLQARAQMPPDNPDLPEARNYVLTMDKIEKLAAAVDDINKLRASNPALKARMDAADYSKLPIDQEAKNIDANFPEVAAVIHSHDLTTREFILVTMAFFNDVAFVGMKKQGAIQAYPPNSITPENAAFVEANWDKLQQLSQKFSQPGQN